MSRNRILRTRRRLKIAMIMTKKKRWKRTTVGMKMRI